MKKNINILYLSLIVSFLCLNSCETFQESRIPALSITDRGENYEAEFYLNSKIEIPKDKQMVAHFSFSQDGNFHLYHAEMANAKIEEVSGDHKTKDLGRDIDIAGSYKKVTLLVPKKSRFVDQFREKEFIPVDFGKNYTGDLQLIAYENNRMRETLAERDFSEFEEPFVEVDLKSLQTNPANHVVKDRKAFDKRLYLPIVVFWSKTRIKENDLGEVQNIKDTFDRAWISYCNIELKITHLFQEGGRNLHRLTNEITPEAFLFAEKIGKQVPRAEENILVYFSIEIRDLAPEYEEHGMLSIRKSLKSYAVPFEAASFENLKPLQERSPFKNMAFIGAQHSMETETHYLGSALGTIVMRYYKEDSDLQNLMSRSGQLPFGRDGYQSNTPAKGDFITERQCKNARDFIVEKSSSFQN